jgi:hypothetical protein
MSRPRSQSGVRPAGRDDPFATSYSTPPPPPTTTSLRRHDNQRGSSLSLSPSRLALVGWWQGTGCDACAIHPGPSRPLHTLSHQPPATESRESRESEPRAGRCGHSLTTHTHTHTHTHTKSVMTDVRPVCIHHTVPWIPTCTVHHRRSSSSSTTVAAAAAVEAEEEENFHGRAPQ